MLWRCRSKTELPASKLADEYYRRPYLQTGHPELFVNDQETKLLIDTRARKLDRVTNRILREQHAGK